MRQVDLGVCGAVSYPGDPTRTVVVLPGARGTAVAGPMWYLLHAVQSRGWSALAVWDEFDGSEPEAWANERAVAAIEHARAAAAETVLVLGKSISSRAAPNPVVRPLPAIWVTPLLVQPAVAAALEEPLAPTLLIGGTDDDLWDSTAAARSQAEVLELEGADHALLLDGDPKGSVGVLLRVVERVDEFVAALGE